MSQPRKRLNRVLGRVGLAQLEDAAGLCNQIGFLIQDHDHFRQLLVACEPEKRTSMYESLRPNLRFEAWPLDRYISAAATIAEQRQYPVLRDGKLHPFRPAEIRTEETMLRDATIAHMAKWRLHLVCRKCTREATFPAIEKYEAVRAAREAGWTYDEVADNGFEICPDCD